MILRQTLIDISNDARGWLKAWTKDFTDDEAARFGGATNPLLWHLGHLACTEDFVCTLFTDEASAVSDDLRAICHSGCPPPTEETVYPVIEDLWTLLDASHHRLVGLIEGAADEDFDRPSVPENSFFRSLGQAVYEAALHENYHVGQIAALRNALGKERVA